MWHNLPSGGGRRALHAHIKGLLERGHQVEIWCPERLDDHFLPLSDLAEEHVVPIPPSKRRSAIGEAVEVLRGVRSDMLAMDLHCRQCAEQIAAGNFDVLFSNTSRDFAVTAIGRFTDLPRVLYLQEPLRELYEASPEIPWSTPAATIVPDHTSEQRSGVLRHILRIRKLGILVREEQNNARAFDRMLVNSFFSRESVVRAYGLDASVCYLGVDTEKFVNLDFKREHRVIGVGAVVPAKAIEKSIDAVAMISEKRPVLDWIGNACDADYRHRLEQRAREKGVEFKCAIGISDAELVDRLNRASVMIYTPRLEPFGYTPLEAAACEIPVVGVREGGLRETVLDGKTGFLTENDPRSLAAALENILSDPDLGRSLGSNGRQWVLEKWTTEHMIDRLEQQLLTTIQRSGQEPDR